MLLPRVRLWKVDESHFSDTVGTLTTDKGHS